MQDSFMKKNASCYWDAVIYLQIIKQESTNYIYEKYGGVFCFNLFHATTEQAYGVWSNCTIPVVSANNRTLFQSKPHIHCQHSCLYLEKEH